MTRARAWWVSYGLLALMCVGLMTFLQPSAKLLEDSDTTLILTEINRQNDPWRWFHHDWPLDNHFYRPLSTAFFELDNRLHPHDAYKWGLTGDLLCVLTTIGLFWMLREITDSPILTSLSTGLFYLWQTDNSDWLVMPLFVVALATLAVGLWRQRNRPSILRAADRAVDRFVRKPHVSFGAKIGTLAKILGRIFRRGWGTWALVLPPALIWFWLANDEISGIFPLGFRMLAWIPGRTASSMTAFAFLSLGAFARYMRLQPRREMPATAFDTPNTRSSLPPSERRPSFLWPVIAIVGEGLALLCYEQAVMVPAILGLIGLAWYLRGATGRWWLWGIPFGLVLLAYIGLRHLYIPPGHSWYYNWQKRTTHTSLEMLQRYLFFFYSSAKELWFYAFVSPVMFLFSTGPWMFAIDTLAAATAFWQVRRRWILCGFGWLGSAVAYGPMAWFKDFGHYHYWPMAFRAFFDVMMAWVAIDLTVIAFSPRARQAPQRLSPAPGSLPHPCSSSQPSAA